MVLLKDRVMYLEAQDCFQPLRIMNILQECYAIMEYFVGKKNFKERNSRTFRKSSSWYCSRKYSRFRMGIRSNSSVQIPNYLEIV